MRTPQRVGSENSVTAFVNDNGREPSRLHGPTVQKYNWSHYVGLVGSDER